MSGSFPAQEVHFVTMRLILGGFVLALRVVDG